MKMTLSIMKKLAKNIENSSCLCASDVDVHETSSDQYSEIVLRYRDGNNFLISCYVFGDTFQILYQLEDGTYKWYCDSKLSAFSSSSDFMFHVGIKLYALGRYIEDYVIC